MSKVESSKGWHFGVTAILALAAGVALFRWLNGVPGGLDPLTTPFVALLFTWFAVLWTAGLKWHFSPNQDAVFVPKGQLLRLPDNELSARLPQQTLEELAERHVAKSRLPGWLALGATTLVSVGLAGTFLGLTIGLIGALPHLNDDEVKLAIEEMLDGAKLAFVKSLVGIVLATIWNYALLGLRTEQDRRYRVAEANLEVRFPPISMEQILAVTGQQTAEAQKRQQDSLTAILAHLSGSQVSRSAAQKEAGDQRNRMVVQLQALSLALAKLSRTLEARSRRLIGSDDNDDSIAGLRHQVVELKRGVEDVKTTVQDIGDNLPDKLGASTGRAVGSVLTPKLSDLSDVLAALGNAGATALGDAMQDNVGQEVGELRAAFAALTSAMAALPSSIAAGSDTAVGTLQSASERGAAQLTEAAKDVSKTTLEAGQTLQDLSLMIQATREIVTSLSDGGEALSRSFAGVAEPLGTLPAALLAAQSGLEKVRSGLTEELGMTTDMLRAQREAQSSALMAWRAESRLLLKGITEAKEGLVEMRESGETFAGSVQRLVSASESTVASMEASAGAQQDGAQEAVVQLLTAVDAFSAALTQNQDQIRDAAFQSVASTEQVTTAAARQVADALRAGAEGLSAAMERNAELSVAIQSQAEFLERSMRSADQVVGGLESHSTHMLSVTSELKDEMGALAQPLREITEGLGQVSPALETATEGMREERRALHGLGKSLSEQASLLRDQEQEMRTRSQEISALHRALGGQWESHVKGMEEAHQRVALAWKTALESAESGHEENAKRVANYAERVEKALGLSSRVDNLRETLQDLADELGELKQPIQELTPQVERLSKTVELLSGG